MLRSRVLNTPLGHMLVVASEQHGLVLCEFHDRPMLPEQLARVAKLGLGEARSGDNPVLDQTARELEEYFAGTRERFDVPLHLGGTEFQNAVWTQLLAIPFGATTSYDHIATRIGKPGAARAVGRANGDNRMAIIVPCHRVINADGTMSGYGGGKHRKRWLLDHERRTPQLGLALSSQGP